MKKIALTLAITSIALNSMAEKRGLYLGPCFAIGKSQMANTNLDPKTFWSPSYNGGLRLGYMFSPYVGIFSGISYQSQSWKYSGDNSYSSTYLEFTHSQVTVPLYIRFVTSKSKKAGFFAHIGVNGNFMLDTKVKLEDKGYTETQMDKESFKPTTFSAYTNMGLVFPIGSKTRFDIGPEYQYSLTDNFNDGLKVWGHLRSLSLRVGLNVLLTSN